jgi:hypothetical protein
MQSVNPLTPLTQIPSRSVAFDTATQKLILGRWVVLDSAGKAIAPGAGNAKKGGVYLVWGASHKVTDGLAASDFDGAGALVDATNLHSIPDSNASGQVGLLYGIFRAAVEPVGFVSTGLAIGDGLEIDAAGRLVKVTTGVRVATVESVSADLLTFRTTGA